MSNLSRTIAALQNLVPALVSLDDAAKALDFFRNNPEIEVDGMITLAGPGEPTVAEITNAATELRAAIQDPELVLSGRVQQRIGQVIDAIENLNSAAEIDMEIIAGIRSPDDEVPTMEEVIRALRTGGDVIQFPG